jgi:uncharacterized membrane protein
MLQAVLESLVAYNRQQHGPPNGSETLLWIIVPVIIIIGIVVILYLYRSWFPRLNSIQPSNDWKDQVIQHTNTVTNNQSESTISETIEESTRTDKDPSLDVMLRLLETDERKVVEALLESDGSMLQKDISWTTGFSRVKTHRVLARLIRRDVVTSEKYYNTNRITLSNWIQQSQ